MNNAVVLKWLGHSCFLVTCNGYRLVFDPFKPGMVPGYNPPKAEADEILCSHGHDDHSYKEVITLKPSGIAPQFKISKVEGFHDDVGGAARGKNTIHILEANGLRIAHFGDIGCRLTQEQVKAVGRLDVAMIPVGGFFTIDAALACEIAGELSPNVVIPMHYRLGEYGFPVIGTLDEFTQLRSDVVNYDTDTIEITSDMTKQTAVLKYKK